MRQKEIDSPWEGTRVQNLFRYEPSGVYFARLKIGGKSIRKSLKTTVFSVAELRLPDVLKENRKIEESRRRFGNGKMTFGDAVQIYRDKLEVNPDLKPKSKYYYRLVLDFLAKTWPSVQEMDVRQITETDCKEWLVRYRQHYAPSVVNNSIGVLRAIFQEAVDVGARVGNPAAALKRSKVRPKKLKLPSRHEFPKFLQTIETGGSRDSKNAADLESRRASQKIRCFHANISRAGNTTLHPNTQASATLPGRRLFIRSMIAPGVSASAAMRSKPGFS